MAHITTSGFAGIQAQSPRIEFAALFRIAAGLTTLAKRAITEINQRRAAYTATDIPARIRRDIGLA